MSNDFKHVVGLDLKQFNNLKELSQPPKKNKWEEYLLIFLVFIRHYPTLVFLAFIFGLSTSGVLKIITKTKRILFRWACTSSQISLPDKVYQKNHARNLLQFLYYFIVDGSEQAIVKSAYSPFFEAHTYSGKYKDNTLKIFLACDYTGKILFLSSTYGGSVNDQTIMYSEKCFMQNYNDE